MCLTLVFHLPMHLVVLTQGMFRRKKNVWLEEEKMYLVIWNGAYTFPKGAYG